MDIIVGTAGHIDHGKTALIKALSGVDADRLPEEQERGITIDLGFADIELDEQRFGFVDVPGHEKFVKNMLAGASGIDVVILVVASDEGVMPQTREHFEICRLLGIQNGVIVMTKTDLIDDEEFLHLVKDDVRSLVKKSFLQEAPIVYVSSKTGEGIDKLKTALTNIVARIPKRQSESTTMLPIDRTFTVRGFGAVVTGTLVTGEIQAGSEMELLPVGRKVRIRGVQSYGNDIELASAGQRTAVNLAGIDHNEIRRGMVLSEILGIRPTQVIDAQVEVLEDSKRALKTRQRVRVHIGTVEAFARVQVLNAEKKIDPGEKDYIQIRFESPIASISGQRFIVRQYSPETTIAGGIILDSHAQKHRQGNVESARRFLGELQRAVDSANRPEIARILLEKSGTHGFSFEDLRAQTGWRQTVLQGALDDGEKARGIVKAGDTYIAATYFEDLSEIVVAAVDNHHRSEPLSRGIPRETLRENTAANVPIAIFKTVIDDLRNRGALVAEQDIIKASEFTQDLSPEEEKVRDELRRIYNEAGLQAPTVENALNESKRDYNVSDAQTRKILQMLIDSNEIVKISDSFYFSTEAIDRLVKKLRNFAEDDPEERLIGVPDFKNLAGVSRKYAIPLLEFFDAQKVTVRAGDKRLIR